MMTFCTNLKIKKKLVKATIFNYLMQFLLYFDRIYFMSNLSE